MSCYNIKTSIHQKQHKITKVVNLSIVCLVYPSVIVYLSFFRSIYHCIVPLFYLSFCLPCMSVLLLHMLEYVRRSQSPSFLVGESLTIFSFSLGKKVSDMRLMCCWGNDTSNRICHFKTSPNPCDLPYLPSEGSVWNAVSKANEENWKKSPVPTRGTMNIFTNAKTLGRRNIILYFVIGKKKCSGAALALGHITSVFETKYGVSLRNR